SRNSCRTLAEAAPRPRLHGQQDRQLRTIVGPGGEPGRSFAGWPMRATMAELSSTAPSRGTPRMLSCDEDLLRRLPLPLARLYRHASNARSALERHQAAYFLWEASLKLL